MTRPFVRPLPGAGIVASEGGLLLVCGGLGDAVDELLEALRQTVLSGGDGRALARRVARVLAETTAAELASCAVAGPAGEGVALLVSGSALASVTGAEGVLTVDNRAALTWTDRFVPGPVTEIVLRLPEAGRADHRYRLDSGVVPAAGLLWTVSAPLPGRRPAAASAPGVPAAPVPPPAAQPPVPVPAGTRPDEPDPAWAPTPSMPQVVNSPPEPPGPVPDGPRADDIRSQPFEAVLLLPDADQRPPAPPEPAQPEPDARPEIWGGDCKNGHFNDPRAHYCGVCGIAMAQLTVVPRRGPRPPLGVLLLDDGKALRLDTDYVLGRDPERAPEVTSGEARPALLNDTSGSVSRRHVRIVLHEWDVQLVDLGSVNGTYVMEAGDTEFRQVPPRQPVTIWPGTRIRLGASRSFRYESHRKR